MKRLLLLLTAAILLTSARTYGQNGSEAERSYYLGYSHQYGENGYAKDLAKAKDYYQKAVNLGKVEACNALGNILYDQKDFSAAFKLFKKSADAGSHIGQYYLAFCYRDGNGITKDQAQAQYLFRESAIGGCLQAYVPLGRILETEDPHEAFACYKKAAEAGFMDGQYNLAMCYIHGIGTDFNRDEAKRWMEKSAAQNYELGRKGLDLINNREFFDKKPSIELIDLPHEVTTTSIKLDVGVKAINGNVKNTAIYLNDKKVHQEDNITYKNDGEGISKGFRLVDEDGYDLRWQRIVNNLREGKNTIRVAATNQAGTGSITRDIYYVLKKKAIINWPQFPETTDRQFFPIKVDISSDSKIENVTLRINDGEPLKINAVGGDMQKTIDETIPLRLGYNNVKIYVTNDAGVQMLENRITYTKPEKRLALVIGNSDYTGTGLDVLRNADNDASAMASRLKELGFDVIEKINADGPTMENGISEFTHRANEYDVALFYYSGHGMQYEDKNFLFPIGVRTTSAADMKFKCPVANTLMEDLEKACRANIIIIDACRTPPPANWPKDKGGENGAGLHEMSASGTIIAYATSPGKKAADGLGDNSPYTEALLELLREHPNWELEKILKQVTKQVRDKTKGKQVPWYTSSFTEDFYFKR